MEKKFSLVMEDVTYQIKEGRNLMLSGNEPKPVMVSMATVRRKCCIWCKRDGGQAGTH